MTASPLTVANQTRLSRRSFFRQSAKAGVLAGLATLAPPFARSSLGQSGKPYAGPLVLVSQSGAAPDKALPKLLDAFSAANPGVTTKLILYPEEKFVAMYTAAQAAGEQVDVLMLNGQDLRRYAMANAVLPFDDVPYKARFLPEALTPFTVGGHLWGVPNGAAGGFVVFANRALLDRHKLALPTTYEELKQIATALSQNGVHAFTHPGKVVYMWPVWFFTTFAQTSGNRSIERTVEILSGKGKFTDPDVVEGIDLVFRFSRDRLFSPGVFGLDFPNAQSELQTGKACFYLFHDSIAKPLVEAQNPDLQLDFMLMPKLTDRPVTSQYPGGPGTVLTVPSRVAPERREAAFSLVDFLSSDASGRESLALNGGAVPVNAQVSPSDNPIYQKEKGEISKMVTYLDWFYPPEITKALQEGLQAGLAGRLKAEALANTLQNTLERLQANGYHFAG